MDRHYLITEMRSRIQTIYDTETEINQGSYPALVFEVNAALPLFQAHLTSTSTIGRASSLDATDAQAVPTNVLGQSFATIGNKSAQVIVAVTHGLITPQSGALGSAVIELPVAAGGGVAATSAGSNSVGAGTSGAMLAQTDANVAVRAQALISVANELTMPQHRGLEGASAVSLSNPTGATSVQALAAIGSGGGTLISASQRLVTPAAIPSALYIL